MTENGTNELNVESHEAESEVLEQLVPRLPSVRRRISIGVALILLATAAGVVVGKGYVVPDPFPSDFVVQDVVVTPFGNDDDVYIQFAVPNIGGRHIELKRVYQDNGLSPKVGAFAELPDVTIFGSGDGAPSVHNYFWREQGQMDPVGGQMVASTLLHNFEELPIAIPPGQSSVVTIIDSVAAEVRFASYQRLSPTRTERFDFADDVNVVAVKETGEILPSVGLIEAICEVAS